WENQTWQCACFPGTEVAFEKEVRGFGLFSSWTRQENWRQGSPLPTAAKPRVIEWLNCSLRVCLRPLRVGTPHGADCSRTSTELPAWDSRDGCPSRRSGSNAAGNLVSILSFGIDKKILRDLLSCGWRRLMFPHVRGEDIPVPGFKNQKTTELLRRTSMKFRPLHDRVVIKRIEAEEKTSGGIIIPDTAKEKPQEGEVIAVGPGGRDESGKLIPI